MHDRPQVWVEESWKLRVYCSVYLEARRFAETTEEQKREGERLLNGLLLMFESYADHEVSEVLRDVCRHYDEMFPYPNGRTDVPLHVVGEAVEEELRFHVQTGSLVIYEDNDRWWERLPPPEETARPRRIPARVVPPREPPPPVEKTWFSAQFVDESGLWIDGLSVKMKVGGATNDLTTDKAGVVELRGQTEASAVVWVADIPQAEKILIDRMGRRDGAPAPTGRDVVDYAVEEPAKNVVLSAESPRTIVLRSRRSPRSSTALGLPRAHRCLTIWAASTGRVRRTFSDRDDGQPGSDCKPSTVSRVCGFAPRFGHGENWGSVGDRPA